MIGSVLPVRRSSFCSDQENAAARFRWEPLLNQRESTIGHVPAKLFNRYELNSWNETQDRAQMQRRLQWIQAARHADSACNKHTAWL